MKYMVFITANNGDDVPQSLQDWDGEEPLILRLRAYANDAIISIEPIYERERDDEEATPSQPAPPVGKTDGQ